MINVLLAKDGGFMLSDKVRALMMIAVEIRLVKFGSKSKFG